MSKYKGWTIKISYSLHKLYCTSVFIQKGNDSELVATGVFPELAESIAKERIDYVIKNQKEKSNVPKRIRS